MYSGIIFMEMMFFHLGSPRKPLIIRLMTSTQWQCAYSCVVAISFLYWRNHHVCFIFWTYFDSRFFGGVFAQ